MASIFVTCLYQDQKEELTEFTGNYILIQSDDSTVVVYQNVCSEIAEYAVNHGFFGGPLFDFNRTTWLKPSFLWTMKKSGWATTSGKERVLAIRIDKAFILESIDMAASNGIMYQAPPGRVDFEAVTLQWDPDYDVDGKKLGRHTLLIGLRTYMLRKWNNEHIIDIADITDFVTEQKSLAQSNDYDAILVPAMGHLVPGNAEICWKIMLHRFYETPPKEELEKIMEIESLRKSIKRSREVALFLQGSFNPVHTRHVQIMLECKEWLEKKTHKKVIAGFFGVNTDEMLMHKIDKQEHGEGLVIREEHRFEICKLAALPYDWIHVRMFREGKPERGDNLKHIVGSHPEWFYLFGADKMTRKDVSKLDHALIIGRHGVTLHVTNACTKSAIKNNVHVIPVELENVNSTEIRRELKHMSSMDTREEKHVIINALIEKGWLDAKVGDYVLDNESDLYEYSTA